MRFAPQSLFARMVLVLLTGLVLAQAASVAIYWRDRDEFIHRAMGLRSVQRVADVIRLLDSMQPAERKRVVGVLHSPQLRIALDAAPLPAGVRGSGDAADQSVRFETALRRVLGERWPLVVHVTDAPYLRGPPAGYGPGMMMKGMGADGMWPGPGAGAYAFAGVSFVVQAKLADGTLVTVDTRQAQDTLARPYRLVVSLAILLAAVIALSLIAVRWVTKPLKTLAEAAERLGADIHRPPLPEAGPVEVARAARAFNTMQQQLVKFINDRTRVFAAMSHDLKTPITRLRLRAEMMEDAALREKIEKDLAEMEGMVSGTLDLMRGFEDREKAQPMNVMALLQTLQEDARTLEGRVTIEGEARAPFVGKPQALKRCIWNVLENALKYGHSAAIRVLDTPEMLECRVADEGPGMPEAELERVFDPFYRLEPSRSRDTGGTGLGLTIARQIARGHHGDLVLRNRAQGGLEAVLTLPRT